MCDFERSDITICFADTNEISSAGEVVSRGGTVSAGRIGGSQPMVCVLYCKNLLSSRVIFSVAALLLKYFG